jgi:hypothetical protein
MCKLDTNHSTYSNPELWIEMQGGFGYLVDAKLNTQ